MQGDDLSPFTLTLALSAHRFHHPRISTNRSKIHLGVNNKTIARQNECLKSIQELSYNHDNETLQ